MFEQEVKTYLTSKGIPFVDNTESKSELDFFLPRNNIYFDVKEKAQHFSIENWKEAPMPQEYLFIIDDLAARKLLFRAPHSFCIIKDSSVSPSMFYVYSIVDLFCIPKKRVKRPIHRSVKSFKGKWLLDLRDAAGFAELADAMEYVLAYHKHFRLIFHDHIECWGKYPSETISSSGTTRIAAYWKKDGETHT